MNPNKTAEISDQTFPSPGDSADLDLVFKSGIHIFISVYFNSFNPFLHSLLQLTTEKFKSGFTLKSKSLNNKINFVSFHL